jgi:hypothetical protein
METLQLGIILKVTTQVKTICTIIEIMIIMLIGLMKGKDMD